MKSAFDVDDPPSADEWLAMGEDERIEAIREAHERTGSPTGQNAAAHAAIHTVVETRLATGDAAVVRAYERCRAAGLDRHATVHALASVVTRHMVQVLEQQEPLDQTAADRDFDALDPAAFSRKRKT